MAFAPHFHCLKSWPGSAPVNTGFNPLAEIFTTATRLEAAFWQMGLNHAAAQRISS
ncbi:Uncharacterised protein [Pantoea agglomerans]|uniref:Uncharacterized protein n=1 Tax=Enterobacter agglomerans TaxID=549 RepID=A0A379LU94_ENTAG|nr:Uncharacterised protein [Pantoea agglomerans]